MPEDTTASRPGRRPHRKSKTGCADCRQRRVKCDEKKPKCSACARRNRICIWPSNNDQGNPSDIHGRASGTRTPSSRTPEPPQPFRIPTSALRLSRSIDASPQTDQSQDDGTFKFDLDDLALLHHWSFTACSTICLARGEVDIWTRLFPEIGFDYPFVARAILSVSALHLAIEAPNLESRAPYMNRAVFHHDASLSSFRHAVTDITPQNSEALFVWSVLNLIYVFGMFSHGPLAPSTTDKDQILGSEWIPMMHGIGVVLRPVREHMAGGRLGTFLSLGNWEDLELDGPDDWDIQMRRTQETWHKSADEGTYEGALSVLRRCRRFMDQFKHMSEAELAQWGYNQAWSAPFIFIGVAPEAFFQLLRQRQPPALVLFAHFGSLLYGNRNYWFIGDLGKKIIEVVDELLGSYWRPYISWPLEHISSGTPATS